MTTHLSDTSKGIRGVIGYMYKIIKNDVPITHYDREFKDIRHGNYFSFINRFKNAPTIEPIYVWHQGDVYTQTEAKKNDIDFISFLFAQPALIEFFKACRAVYGNQIDNDLTDLLFEKAVMFELCLRMQGSNYHLLEEEENLKPVIEKVCKHLSISDEDESRLHNGRYFINAIKRKKELQTKFQGSWDTAKKAFEEAFETAERLEFIF
jgi:hypothetical protein